MVKLPWGVVNVGCPAGRLVACTVHVPPAQTVWLCAGFSASSVDAKTTPTRIVTLRIVFADMAFSFSLCRHL